jgi:hypothetical protein
MAMNNHVQRLRGPNTIVKEPLYNQNGQMLMGNDIYDLAGTGVGGNSSFSNYVRNMQKL